MSQMLPKLRQQEEEILKRCLETKQAHLVGVFAPANHQTLENIKVRAQLKMRQLLHFLEKQLSVFKCLTIVENCLTIPENRTHHNAASWKGKCIIDTAIWYIYKYILLHLYYMCHW